MRKLALLIALALTGQNKILSQSCLPNGIAFYTQAEIDGFQASHPDCDEIEGVVFIAPNNDITNLNGLSILTSIGGNLVIEANGALTSLAGLDNLDSIGGNLCIVDNALLSTCEVRSICEYLANPNGDIDISDNTVGCNTQQEVEEACLSVGVSDLDPGLEVSIYHNPVSTLLTISSQDEMVIDRVNIYNKMGHFARILQLT